MNGPANQWKSDKLEIKEADNETNSETDCEADNKAATENSGETFVGRVNAPAEPLSLWYRHPARQWVEALPIGNGRLGAMVFGGVETERLQLNEGTLWSGGPRETNNPGAKALLPQVREALFAGRYAEAEALTKQMQGPWTESYLPLGDLTLEFTALATRASRSKIISEAWT